MVKTPKRYSIMTNSYVTVKGTKYYVKSGTLDLGYKGITDITEIDGLEALVQLRILDLNHNQIKEISGLEHLSNLKDIYIGRNPIRDEERHLIGKNAQEIVRYCQEKL